jgi:chorismate dehydratase
VRVGRIPYLNVFPYYRGTVCEHFEPFVEGPPSVLGRMAAEGLLDAAPLAAVDTFRLEESFEPLGTLGIASRGPVQSVLLFSRRPIDQLSGARVVLSGESVTSAALTRMLLEDTNAGDIHFDVGEEVRSADAILAIGDRALRLRKEPPFEICTDLGELWYKKTHLPFVFARWVVRRSASPADKRRLEAGLKRALHQPLPEDIPNAAGLTGVEARQYLGHIVHTLDETCLMGLQLFKDKLHVLT